MNSILKRLSIPAKVNAPIFGIALALCVSSVWLSQVLLETDATYSRFLKKEVKAQELVLRARINYNRMLAGTYRVIAESDKEKIGAIMASTKERYDLAIERLKDAAETDPAQAPALEGLKKGIETIYVGMNEAMEHGAKNLNGEALAVIHNKVEPLIEPILTDFDALQKSIATNVENGTTQLQANSASTSERAIVSGVGVSLVMFAIAFVVGRYGITRPLSSQIATIEALCRNDLSVKVEGADRGDEIGNLARAAAVFRDNLVRVAAMEEEKKETERRAAEQRKAELASLANRFQQAIGGIVETVSGASSKLEGAAVILSKTASSTEQLSSTVAAASEETSANVQGVASASEQLASTVTEIGRQVQESATIASKAVSQAAETNKCVNELSDAASRIGDVVNLITTIAGQTNLLALNATIEAARAGDAGKGFAVVAQEVKALASQTEKATNEISAQISSMQGATEQAVSAIQEITDTINRMSEIAGAIAAAVEEQDATTREISRNVLEAAKGTSEVASNITEVSSGASQTGSASSEVLTSARKLAQESESLRREVDGFLSSLRAA